MATKNEKEFLDKTYDMFRKHWSKTNNAEESWERTKRLLHWYRIGLKDGVTEQRKMDIDKACDFIKRNTTLDRWVNVDAIAEQLRKAMEE